MNEVLTVERVASIDSVPAESWDACAGFNPFVRHGFLKAMEDSGSVGKSAGWLPQHLVARAGDAIVGVVPLYLKGNSYGEYVFDHGWADAYERAGGRYYPKLQVASPFSPVPGPRLLSQNPLVRQALAHALVQTGEQTGVSSVHVTFATRGDAEDLEAAGFLIRQGYQFHWENRGYADFDGFLADLASRKRKAIRKERAQALAAGLTIKALTGDDLTPDIWDFFFRCYRSTTDRKWGSPYLTRPFFDCLGASMADSIVLMVAYQDGRPVAGALNLKSDDTLYGRNWGALGHFPFLHFELCYYQALDYAIANGLSRVEAGAQGEHKLQRGYLPSATWSAHWIADKGFRKAVADFVNRERVHVGAMMTGLSEYAPFRHDMQADDEAVG
jgi:predicted N-acyltransferase